MTAPLTVLLTGSSGVVGRALLRSLSRHRVICLTHKTVPDAALDHVSGNLTAADLGLDSRTRSRLLDQVDTIVHCAAVTDFSAGNAATHNLNVLGTQRLLEFAATAGASLHYLSTAFVARAELARSGSAEGFADPSHYLESKRAAEQVVRASGLPTTIIRPSVVIGDSASGTITRFQGLHTLIRSILKNTLPLLPLDPQAHVDFVPLDVVSAAIASIVDSRRFGGEYWITASDQAPTTQTVLDLTVQVGSRLGIDVRAPRLVDPSMVDRLIRPVFIEPLPGPLRRRFDDMVASAALFSNADLFPSSMSQIAGSTAPAHESLMDAYGKNVEHLIRTQRMGSSASVAA